VLTERDGADVVARLVMPPIAGTKFKVCACADIESHCIRHEDFKKTAGFVQVGGPLMASYDAAKRELRVTGSHLEPTDVLMIKARQTNGNCLLYGPLTRKEHVEVLGEPLDRPQKDKEEVEVVNLLHDMDSFFAKTRPEEAGSQPQPAEPPARPGQLRHGQDHRERGPYEREVRRYVPAEVTPKQAVFRDMDLDPARYLLCWNGITEVYQTRVHIVYPRRPIFLLANPQQPLATLATPRDWCVQASFKIGAVHKTLETGLFHFVSMEGSRSARILSVILLPNSTKLGICMAYSETGMDFVETEAMPLRTAVHLKVQLRFRRLAVHLSADNGLGSSFSSEVKSPPTPRRHVAVMPGGFRMMHAHVHITNLLFSADPQC